MKALLAAGDEQHSSVLGVQELADRVLSPALAAVRQRSHQPSSVSTAVNPRADSARITLDLPVPDIPVSSTRFTAAILRPGMTYPPGRTSGHDRRANRRI
jgi:hypothetical protein